MIGNYKLDNNIYNIFINIGIEVKGYLRYKTVKSQSVLSEAQVKNFFIS